jgi:hypothetical protein
MDHETAVRTGAAERYFLGYLTGQDRDSYEEHYFMCPECAEDLRTLSVFAANAKAVFRGENAAAPAVHAGVLSSGWALPLSAALNFVLLLAVGYGLLKVRPETRRELAEARAPQFVQQVTVLGPSRGDGAARDISPRTQRIVFSFYLTRPFRNLGYEVKDESGAVHLRQILPTPPKEDSDETHLSLSTAGLKPGAYEISLWGAEDSGEIPIGKSKFKIDSPR